MRSKMGAVMMVDTRPTRRIVAPMSPAVVLLYPKGSYREYDSDRCSLSNGDARTKYCALRIEKAVTLQPSHHGSGKTGTLESEYVHSDEHAEYKPHDCKVSTLPKGHIRCEFLRFSTSERADEAPEAWVS